MEYRFQYGTEEQRNELVEIQQDKYMIREENLFEGNFLVFSDTKPEVQVTTVEVVQPVTSDDLTELQSQIQDIKQGIAEMKEKMDREA